MALHYPTGRRLKLVTEETDNGVLSLVMGIPGVSDLSLCWSNSPTDLYSVEAAEILEKCLLWNYENALRMWATSG